VTRGELPVVAIRAPIARGYGQSAREQVQSARYRRVDTQAGCFLLERVTDPSLLFILSVFGCLPDCIFCRLWPISNAFSGLLKGGGKQVGVILGHGWRECF